MTVITHLINGKIRQPDGRTASVFNPATGKPIRQVELASAATVQEAIAAAKAALPAWRNLPPAKRTQVLFRFKQLLEEHQEEIVQLISEEHGKTREDAAGELKRGIENVEYASAAPELLKGEYSRNAGPGIDSWSDFHAVGVVAGITPFNFPAMVPLWMWPMAVACGNTFVLKPSERVPSAALYIARLAAEAGLPPGVLNVVNGDREAVETLLHDGRVKAISFVGSTPVAEHIYHTGCAQNKRVQALGGAKNHAVVLPDADIPGAVGALMGAAFGSCGQRCMAIPLVVAVGDGTADALIAGLRQQMAAMRVGPGSDNRNDMGPLVTQQHYQKVKGYIDQGMAEGAELLVDGRELSVIGADGRPSQGYFLGPTLFDRVTPGMRIYQEEIFGPVLGVVRAASLPEAMAMIDAHEYGNGTCLFTRDGEAARYFSSRIQVGMVGINVALPVPVAYHSFGGWKRSLFGDLHAYGPDAVRFYTKRKTVTQRWPASGDARRASFSFPSGQG